MVVVLPEAHLEPPLLFHLVAWTAGWRRRCPRPMLLLPLTYDSCLGSRNEFWNFPDPWQRQRESRIELIWVWTQFRPDPPRISWIHNWWTKNCALWIGYRVTIIHGGFWWYQGTAFALAVTCSSMSLVIAFISQHLFEPIGSTIMTWPPLPGVSSVIGFWGSYMSRLERGWLNLSNQSCIIERWNMLETKQWADLSHCYSQCNHSKGPLFFSIDVSLRKKFSLSLIYAN